ncbi:hypothetical protein [Micromonospora zhanjiangensis]|uniref:Zinc-finger n=1 Tax=Micromonospora zhanjiangensis TaxID=1522057 RepID=A0ABV8KP11_9ACTN
MTAVAPWWPGIAYDHLDPTCPGRLAAGAHLPGHGPIRVHAPTVCPRCRRRWLTLRTKGRR